VPIGTDVQTILRRYQRLKMAKPTEWFAGHYRLPGIAAERMKPIIAFGAQDPYNRVRMSVRPPSCDGMRDNAVALPFLATTLLPAPQ